MEGRPGQRSQSGWPRRRHGYSPLGHPLSLWGAGHRSTGKALPTGSSVRSLPRLCQVSGLAAALSSPSSWPATLPTRDASGDPGGGESQCVEPQSVELAVCQGWDPLGSSGKAAATPQPQSWGSVPDPACLHLMPRHIHGAQWACDLRPQPCPAQPQGQPLPRPCQAGFPLPCLDRACRLGRWGSQCGAPTPLSWGVPGGTGVSPALAPIGHTCPLPASAGDPATELLCVLAQQWGLLLPLSVSTPTVPAPTSLSLGSRVLAIPGCPLTLRQNSPSTLPFYR